MANVAIINDPPARNPEPRTNTYRQPFRPSGCYACSERGHIMAGCPKLLLALDQGRVLKGSRGQLTTRQGAPIYRQADENWIEAIERIVPRTHFVSLQLSDDEDEEPESHVWASHQSQDSTRKAGPIAAEAPPARTITPTDVITSRFDPTRDVIMEDATAPRTARQQEKQVAGPSRAIGRKEVVKAAPRKSVLSERTTPDKLLEQVLSSPVSVTEYLKYKKADVVVGSTNIVRTSREPLIRLPMNCNGHSVDFVVDTGSEINLISQEVWKRLKLPMDRSKGGSMKDANGGLVTQADFYVTQNAPFTGLLGRPWQRGNAVSISEKPDGTYIEFPSKLGNSELAIPAENTLVEDTELDSVNMKPNSVTVPGSPSDLNFLHRRIVETMKLRIEPVPGGNPPGVVGRVMDVMVISETSKDYALLDFYIPESLDAPDGVILGHKAMRLLGLHSDPECTVGVLGTRASHRSLDEAPTLLPHQVQVLVHVTVPYAGFSKRCEAVIDAHEPHSYMSRAACLDMGIDYSPRKYSEYYTSHRTKDPLYLVGRAYNVQFTYGPNNYASSPLDVTVVERRWHPLVLGQDWNPEQWPEIDSESEDKDTSQESECPHEDGESCSEEESSSEEYDPDSEHSDEEDTSEDELSVRIPGTIPASEKDNPEPEIEYPGDEQALINIRCNGVRTYAVVDPHSPVNIISRNLLRTIDTLVELSPLRKIQGSNGKTRWVQGMVPRMVVTYGPERKDSETNFHIEHRIRPQVVLGDSWIKEQDITLRRTPEGTAPDLDLAPFSLRLSGQRQTRSAPERRVKPSTSTILSLPANKAQSEPSQDMIGRTFAVTLDEANTECAGLQATDHIDTSSHSELEKDAAQHLLDMHRHNPISIPVGLPFPAILLPHQQKSTASYSVKRQFDIRPLPLKGKKLTWADIHLVEDQKIPLILGADWLTENNLEVNSDTQKVQRLEQNTPPLEADKLQPDETPVLLPSTEDDPMEEDNTIHSPSDPGTIQPIIKTNYDHEIILDQYSSDLFGRGEVGPMIADFLDPFGQSQPIFNLQLHSGQGFRVGSTEMVGIKGMMLFSTKATLRFDVDTAWYGTAVVQFFPPTRSVLEAQRLADRTRTSEVTRGPSIVMTTVPREAEHQAQPAQNAINGRQPQPPPALLTGRQGPVPPGVNVAHDHFVAIGRNPEGTYVKIHDIAHSRTYELVLQDPDQLAASIADIQGPSINATTTGSFQEPDYSSLTFLHETGMSEGTESDSSSHSNQSGPEPLLNEPHRLLSAPLQGESDSIPVEVRQLAISRPDVTEYFTGESLRTRNLVMEFTGVLNNALFRGRAFLDVSRTMSGTHPAAIGSHTHPIISAGRPTPTPVNGVNNAFRLRVQRVWEQIAEFEEDITKLELELDQRMLEIRDTRHKFQEFLLDLAKDALTTLQS
ncbi:hypothetical protein BXZ70DRAFT_1057676 [Cristinia sonorae]|uniref:CCHC-type domain-containing protein n=1 Tax=Cristinia sonorae TaxID=1940300 RepID=A0A8K0UTG3_9AGAR|nr:hypothetical protein BXZ70DRAFT_1057676 [Cristinia sonorae]